MAQDDGAGECPIYIVFAGARWLSRGSQAASRVRDGVYPVSPAQGSVCVGCCHRVDGSKALDWDVVGSQVEMTAKYRSERRRSRRGRSLEPRSEDRYVASRGDDIRVGGGGAKGRE